MGRGLMSASEYMPVYELKEIGEVEVVTREH